jgi:hypothetical protein
MGGLGDAGDGGTAPEAGAGDDSPIGGHAGEGGHVSDGEHAGNGGEGGEILKTPDAGAGGEAGAVSVVCDASVDLKTDPMNCGACGHDCLGGECDAGQCRPTTIASQQDEPGTLATDETYIYWMGTHDALARNYYIARRRIDGTDDVKEIANSEAQISALTLSSSNLYWVNADHVRACSVPNCLEGPHDIVATASTRCLDVLYEPSNSTLYWSCVSNYQQNDGSLWSITVPGSTPTHVEPSSANPSQMTSDGENVYWQNSSGFGSDNNLAADGAIWKLHLQDGSRTKLVSGLTMNIGYLAMGGKTLYFSNSTDTELLGLPLPYGAAVPTKITNASVYGMVADERAVYWSDCGKGVINRCPHSGCSTPEPIAVGQSCPRSMAQDAKSIYWLSAEGGASVQSYPIQRLAK